MKNLHLMMDFETLGLTSNAPIVQIGAVYFNPATGSTHGAVKFCLELEDVFAKGFRMEEDTVQWWRRQSEEARSRVFASSAEGYDTHTAITCLTEFMKHAKQVWCHLTLDAMLLAEYQNRLDIPPSVPHYLYRDLRTLVDLAGVNLSSFPCVGVAHDALDDCYFQVQYCVAALNILKGRREANHE